jgi:hypothetical protein
MATREYVAQQMMQSNSVPYRFNSDATVTTEEFEAAKSQKN